jgi:hypothetical protein
MLRKQGAFAELSVSAWRLIRVTMRVACVRYTILLSVYVRRVTSHHNVIIFFSRRCVGAPGCTEACR